MAGIPTSKHSFYVISISTHHGFYEILFGWVWLLLIFSLLLPTKSIKSQNTKSNKNPRTYFGVRIWWTSCSTYKFFIDSRFRPWDLRPGPQSLVWFDLFIFKVHRLSWMCCRPEQKKIIIICFVVIDGYKKCYLIFPIY